MLLRELNISIMLTFRSHFGPPYSKNGFEMNKFRTGLVAAATVFAVSTAGVSVASAAAGDETNT